MTTTAKPLPRAESLHELMEYDPGSGIVRWRQRSTDSFEDRGGRYTADWCARRWNARDAGKLVGETTGAEGYRRVGIGGRSYPLHRIIWVLMTGEDPPEQIDHINGDRGDNRWINLRAATKTENARNQRLFCTNKSGVVGVRYNESIGKFMAYIWADGKQRHLGCFDDMDAAVGARARAERSRDFHENHGRARA